VRSHAGWPDPGATKESACYGAIRPWFRYMIVHLDRISLISGPWLHFVSSRHQSRSTATIPRNASDRWDRIRRDVFQFAPFRDAKSSRQHTRGNFNWSLRIHVFKIVFCHNSKLTIDSAACPIFGGVANAGRSRLLCQRSSSRYRPDSPRRKASTLPRRFANNANSSSDAPIRVSSLSFGFQMIQIGTAISVGLLASALLVYPFAQKRSDSSVSRLRLF
jgi:hypothetical protein